MRELVSAILIETLISIWRPSRPDTILMEQDNSNLQNFAFPSVCWSHHMFLEILRCACFVSTLLCSNHFSFSQWIGDQSFWSVYTCRGLQEKTFIEAKASKWFFLLQSLQHQSSPVCEIDNCRQKSFWSSLTLWRAWQLRWQTNPSRARTSAHKRMPLSWWRRRKICPKTPTI